MKRLYHIGGLGYIVDDGKENTMSVWTHLICDTCYERAYPNRDALRLRDDKGKCCFCGHETTSGIYVRTDPKTLLCKGVHA